MKKITIAIMAHVDAGKTTLSETILYKSGAIKKLGRVDHKDTFLDTNSLEKQRGITIFSKQAQFVFGDTSFTLLDTPGHVDFSAETERTLQVADYAVLVISASDIVQGHTQTLWNLLTNYKVPCFIFVNKVDLVYGGFENIQNELCKRLSDSCIDFTSFTDETYEKIAMGDEEALSSYLESGEVSEEKIKELIAKRKVFPCFYGSALKDKGVDEFLDALCNYTEEKAYGEEFGARVYKITYDNQGNRLTHLKVTGGKLKVKDIIHHSGVNEKINQLRMYSGAKFESVQEAESGDICAVMGFEKTFPGEAMGFEEGETQMVLEPVLTCKIIPTENIDIHSLYIKLLPLADEDPTLKIVWDENLKEIHIRPMGEIQLEVLKQLIKERFDIDVVFGEGNILYKETILNAVEGVGHFEPLRHYAEVHLLLEPAKKGSGIIIGSACSEDELDKNWQRLILTHLYEKTHIGVLTGSPITDIKITLVSGRAHLKHTEGGDFREATYRALRNGLMNAQSQLLEPYYSFRIEVPLEYTGRVITDIQNLNGIFETPLTEGEYTVISGEAPVSTIREYPRTLNSYTSGKGRISLSPCGYRKCHNADEVIEGFGYDAERDIINSPDSVFCAHGAGFIVKWNDVPKYMHLESYFKKSSPVSVKEETAPAKRQAPTSSLEQDKELYKIFENTYGPIKRKNFVPSSTVKAADENKRIEIEIKEKGPQYLLVDGYNMIFAWDNLKDLARDNLDAARETLVNSLINYKAYKKCEVILVFDAYKVHGGIGAVEKTGGIYVVYTKEAETADMYIEKTTYEIGRKYNVRVATSDNMEQMIIESHGCTHVSALMLKEEVDAVNREIGAILDSQKQKNAKKSFSKPNIK